MRSAKKAAHKAAFFCRMKTLKHIVQITNDSGVETKIEATVYDDRVSWYRSERMQFYEGESWTAEQSIAEYRTSGPPDIAAGITVESKAKIDGALRGL